MLKKIEIHVPAEIRAQPEDAAQKDMFALSYVGQLQAALAQSSPSEERETQLQTSGGPHAIAGIGVPPTAREEHGVMHSQDYDAEEQQEEDLESTEPSSQVEQFISLAELKAHRLSQSRKPLYLRHYCSCFVLEYESMHPNPSFHYYFFCLWLLSSQLGSVYPIV